MKQKVIAKLREGMNCPDYVQPRCWFGKQIFTAEVDERIYELMIVDGYHFQSVKLNSKIYPNQDITSQV